MIGALGTKFRFPASAVSLAVLAIAMAIRLVRLGHESFWFDEVATIGEADPSILRILGRFYWPPVYSLLMKPLVATGAGELGLRLPAAIFGALTVTALHRRLAKRVDPWIAFGAAMLLATSAFHIELSQQVRHYTLGLLLMWLAHAAFEDLLTQPTPAAIRRWGGLAALSYLTIFLAAPLLVAQGIHGTVRLRGAARRRFVVAGVIVVAVLSPWILGSLEQSDRVPNQLRYAGGHWQGMVDALAKATFGYLRLPAAVLFGGFAALAAILVAGLRRGPFPTSLAAGGGALLVGLAGLTSVVSDPYPRYFVLAIPFLVALLAIALSRLPRPAAAAILAVLLTGSILEGANQLRARQHPDWRSLAAELARADLPRDTVLVFAMPNMEKTVKYYLRRDHPGAVDPGVKFLAGGYSMDEAGARKVGGEIDAMAAESSTLVYVEGFEWFSDPERMALHYLKFRYGDGRRLTTYPTATVYDLREPGN